MKKLFFLTCLILSFVSTPAFASYVPDTGQTKCYSNETEISCPLPGEPFYGQDASYNCNPHSYTDLGNGIVRDNVTGLEWQQATAPGTYTWDQAITYCDNLVLGSYSDWRLPTIKELATLVDSSIPSPGPSINTNFFLNTVSTFYWSSTPDVGTTTGAWTVYFNFGGVYYTSSKALSYRVMAVRSGQTGAFDNFVITGDGTATDKNTGLIWQQATAPGTYTWEQALTYCENLSLAGYSDWRLPNRNELQSIVDYERVNPSINTTYFPDTVVSRSEASYYWSSTTYAGNTNYAWGVSFGNGDVTYYWDIIHYFYKSDYKYVRAVRSGQCGFFGDSDGDGIFDDGDLSSIVGDNPCTGGNTVFCDDNCPALPNPDQADTDGDGDGDVCDKTSSIIIPLDLSNELPEGTAYAKVTLELIEDGCPGSFDGVKINVDADENVLIPDDNFGIQRFGFNYAGNVSNLTIDIFDDPTGKWAVDTNKNISEFGIFLYDASGTGSTRKDPLMLEICSCCDDLKPEDLFVENIDGYVFVAHITDFNYEGYDQTSAYFSFTPTFAEEIIFNITPANSIVTLTWTAVSEENVLGYNILRKEGITGSYKQINDNLITGKGSIETTVDYEFIDAAVQNGRLYQYKLVEVETDGDTKEHGPVKVIPRMVYTILER